MRQISSIGRLYGNLKVMVYDNVGGKKKLLFRIQKRNQIVDDGRLINLELLAQLPSGSTPQANPEWNQIWSLGVGESSVPAAASQTGLISPVWNDALVIPAEREYVPGLYEIVVLKEVPAGEATNAIFAEVGLFSRGELDAPDITYPTWESIPNRRMYARQTFTTFEKTATMSVTFDWHIGLTVAAP